jgi:hypothetical protein
LAKKWPFMRHKFSIFFLQNCKKLAGSKNEFYVIAFDLTKIFKSWASQNDRQIISFVKASWQKNDQKQF